MKYTSTRGVDKGRSFATVVLKGLADDGGLFVPESIPQITHETLLSWRHLSYPQLAHKILSLFIEESEVPSADLKDLIERSYSTFFVEDVVQIKPLMLEGEDGGHPFYVAELFHGPTFSFKDFALQFLGNLFEYFLCRNERENRQDKEQSGELDESKRARITVLGATSGDTGSAAIAGLRGKKNVEVFVLHPRGRVSPIQEKQMTSITDPNVHNIAVEGTFDDCQAEVKQIFNDLPFKRKHNLAAINSINWARILAQTVYYFYSYFQVTSPIQQREGAKIVFSVPTGNFGNVLSGYYAKQMGLPIHRLIVATNQNDILHRFFSGGRYEVTSVKPSMSPSMDIQVASNMERFLFHMSGNNASEVQQWMAVFQKEGLLVVPESVHTRALQEVTSVAASEEQTLSIIKRYHAQADYTLCPHSAIGVHGLEVKAKELRNAGEPKSRPLPNIFVSLATAHPAKFPVAIETAIGSAAALPKSLAEVMEAPTQCHNLPYDADALKAFIEKTLEDRSSSGGLAVRQSFRVRVPGSCANLGSGFDVLGLAVDRYLTVDVTVSVTKQEGGEKEHNHSKNDKTDSIWPNAVNLTISFEGDGEGSVPLDENNLIWQSVLHVVTSEQKKQPGLCKKRNYKQDIQLAIKNEVPLARGLGSSGCATVAGVMIANKLLDLGLNKAAVLAYCDELEGHPDNVGASVYGGVTACCAYSDDGVKKVHTSCVPFSKDIKVVVVVPNFEVSTEKARAALPPTWPKGDVVFNLQRVTSLVLGLETGDQVAVNQGLQDKLHQPYRSFLIPGLESCLAMNNSPMEGLLGVCLSGSGSTIMAIATGNFEGIAQAMLSALTQQKQTAKAMILQVDTDGATLTNLHA